MSERKTPSFRINLLQEGQGLLPLHSTSSTGKIFLGGGGGQSKRCMFYGDFDAGWDCYPEKGCQAKREKCSKKQRSSNVSFPADRMYGLIVCHSRAHKGVRLGRQKATWEERLGELSAASCAEVVCCLGGGLWGRLIFTFVAAGLVVCKQV